jgi:alkanesulfonate monooxygenase SsuD/methylene tetrahydromethanopterin reductase-like flavin-dependent oxidoreductase (luciferase family)
MRLLAERSVYMGTRMPQLIGLFGDLWLTRWMNTPDVQKTLAELTILSQGAGRLAVTAEDIAGRLTQERDATLKLIKAYVSQERDQAVKQLIDGVSAQRRALLREILAEERLIENRLRDQVSVIVDQQGRQLIDYAMRQLAILVVVGLIGYVVAILIFRFASNKFDIFKKVS